MQLSLFQPPQKEVQERPAIRLDIGGVFVLNHDYTPMLPISKQCSEFLLINGHAATYRHYPNVIILKKQQVDNRPLDRYTVELKIDPGARHSGLALVIYDKVTKQYTALWGANLSHKGHVVTMNLLQRRGVRRSRRNRKTRYRPPRFDNRGNARQEGRLMPSSLSILNNLINWSKRLQRYIPIHSIAFEWVKFDTQKMANPEISGVEYQQGELEGYETREYLLEKYHRTCVYCGADNKNLQIEHVVPRSKGGSNRVSNLVLACEKCNQAKGNKPIEEFLAKKPDLLKKILGGLKKPLQTAAAVQTIRKATHERLTKATGLPVHLWSGGRTKMNRVKQKYEKDHWIDAVCTGETGAAVTIPEDLTPLTIKAMGRGDRQSQTVDGHGFPRMKVLTVKGKPVLNANGKPMKVRCSPKMKSKRIGANGVQTGDMILFRQAKKPDIIKARVSSIDKTGGVTIKHPTTKGKRLSTRAACCKILQKADGYDYQNEDEDSDDSDE